MRLVLPPTPHLFSLLLQLLCLGALCLFFFNRNELALFYGYDGSYIRELVKFQFDWSEPSAQLVLNPLQGFSTFSFPLNFWYSPAFLVSYLLFGPEPQPVFVYSILTAELFLAVWLLALTMGVSPLVRLGASWTIAIFAMPFIVPPHGRFFSFEPISGLLPWIIEHIALSTVTLSLILRLRVVKSASETGLLFAFLGAASALSAIAFPFSMILSAPLLGLFFIAALYSRMRHISITFLVSAAAILLLLLLPLLFQLSLYTNTTPVFFNDELAYGREDWVFISVLFHGFVRREWIASIVYVLGLSGGLYAAFRSPSPVAFVARFYVIYSLTLLFIGCVATFVVTSYRGPTMLYFEWFTWPFMFIFVWWLFHDLVIKWKPHLRWTSVGVGLGFPLLAAIFVLSVSKPKFLPYSGDSFRRPPGETKFTELLKHQVGLIPGATWRGSVATFNGNTPGDEGSTWRKNWEYDLGLWEKIGNDHRSFGLWWYGIPTLFSYNQFFSADYFLVMTRFFARASDEQQRNVVVLSRPNVKLLALFGVRFVISERKLEETREVALRDSLEWIWKQPEHQYLYEIARPNLGDFSPTRQVVEMSARRSISIMQADDFDPTRDVVLKASVPAPLVQAKEASLTWEKGGAVVQARSPGTSLLILPLQYSHCLEIDSPETHAESEAPQLIRSDISLVGVLFTKSLDARINLRFGPYSNVLCRTRDFFEFRDMLRASE